MSSHRRRNSDWQAYGQHRRRHQVFYERRAAQTKAGRLEDAVGRIKRQFGDDAIMTGAEYEQRKD